MAVVGLPPRRTTLPAQMDTVCSSKRRPLGRRGCCSAAVRTRLAESRGGRRVANADADAGLLMRSCQIGKVGDAPAAGVDARCQSRRRFESMARGKWKPQRGGARRFTSSRDPNAYVHNNRREASESEEDEEGSGSEGEKTTSTTSSSGTEDEGTTTPLNATSGGQAAHARATAVSGVLLFVTLASLLTFSAEAHRPPL